MKTKPTIMEALMMILVFSVLSIAMTLVYLPTIQASGFILQVNLYDGQQDSGRVNVVVKTAFAEKSRTLDVGRIVSATGNSNIQILKFGFSDRELPSNGAFTVCVISKLGSQCEQADRHRNADSAVIFIQVPN